MFHVQVLDFVPMVPRMTKGPKDQMTILYCADCFPLAHSCHLIRSIPLQFPSDSLVSPSNSSVIPSNSLVNSLTCDDATTTRVLGRGLVPCIAGSRYSMTPAHRTPYLIDRTPPTSSQFHCLSGYLDLLPQGLLGYPRGQSPPGTLGATGEDLDS